MVKTFIENVLIVFDILASAKSPLLLKIRNFCRPEIMIPIKSSILEIIHEDVSYVKTPLDLRNQRTFAVKVSGAENPKVPLLTSRSRESMACWMWHARCTKKALKTFRPIHPN
jgi:hypothetical protein